MEDFIAIIPARLTSTRLPEKVLADIGGVPMVVRAARKAMASGAKQVIVAADDFLIVSACNHYGVDAVLTDKKHATGTDRLAEAVHLLGLDDEAIVVNVQADEPFIPPELIQAVAHLLASRSNCSIATCAHPIHTRAEIFNPNIVKVVCDAQYRALLFSRAPIPWGRECFAKLDDELPANAPPILRHIGLYAYRAGFLRKFPKLSNCLLEQFEALEQLRALWHGFEIAVQLIDHPPPSGVDTPEDLARVRKIIQQETEL